MAHNQVFQDDSPGCKIVEPFAEFQMKPDIIIAIDPDVEKSGVAELCVRTRDFYNLENMDFPKLIDFVKMWRTEYEQRGLHLLVVVEAGWMNRSNWHLSMKESKQRAASKGYDVGRNHETGRKIVECLKHYGVDVMEHIPLRKGWKGKDGKITSEELAYFTGIERRTNQDVRDAALLAWSVANLPIRVKC